MVVSAISPCTFRSAGSFSPVGARPQRIRLPEVHHGRVGVRLLCHLERPQRLQLVEVPGLQQPLQRVRVSYSSLYSSARSRLQKRMGCWKALWCT